MEELQARHRKEQKDLQGRITQKKKQASKKTRKGVNDECDRLEADLKRKQSDEIAALNGEPTEDGDADLKVDEPTNDPVDEPNGVAKPQAAPPEPVPEKTSIPPETRKPNRQKARLARRAAEQEEAVEQAAKEAENLPDLKQQERERMLSHMKEHGLREKEIRADGHCLYSAVADQLDQLSIPLSPGDRPDVQPYKLTRGAAADWIETHADGFVPFLEEPMDEYVKKIRDTGEWGGQVELIALARSYGTRITVLQDFGRLEKFEPEDGSSNEGKDLWLAYYKHGFGLGEHYNSLRKAG